MNTKMLEVGGKKVRGNRLEVVGQKEEAIFCLKPQATCLPKPWRRQERSSNLKQSYAMRSALCPMRYYGEPYELNKLK